MVQVQHLTFFKKKTTEGMIFSWFKFKDITLHNIIVLYVWLWGTEKWYTIEYAVRMPL